MTALQHVPFATRNFMYNIVVTITQAKTSFVIDESPFVAKEMGPWLGTNRKRLLGDHVAHIEFTKPVGDRPFEPKPIDEDRFRDC
jgi:hypothetical protein